MCWLIYWLGDDSFLREVEFKEVHLHVIVTYVLNNTFITLR